MHTLLKGLEKIAASADIPMLVAGDFNSVPGSAAHSLLINNSVDADHRVRPARTVPGWAAVQDVDPPSSQHVTMPLARLALPAGPVSTCLHRLPSPHHGPQASKLTVDAS